MVIKGADIVEISPDQWETNKTNTKRRKNLTEEEEEEEIDGTPIRAIFCLKTRQDMKTFEDKEDCFILDFDPNDTFDSRKHSISNNPDEDDNDLAIIHEKGQVACRDYPHSRHLCSKFPFGSTHHATHCNLCYCYVCDVAAPCAKWTYHCDAVDNVTWKRLRAISKDIDIDIEAAHRVARAPARLVTTFNKV